MAKPLIAFYSRTGTTRDLAHTLGQMTNGRIHEIIDHKNREGLLGNLGSGLDALLQRSTRISPLPFSLEAQGPIILGSTVWLGHIPPALSTFITQYHPQLPDKIGFFCTFSGGGEAGACRQAATLLGRDVPCLCISPTLSPDETDRETKKFMAQLMA